MSLQSSLNKFSQWQLPPCIFTVSAFHPIHAFAIKHAILLYVINYLKIVLWFMSLQCKHYNFYNGNYYCVFLLLVSFTLVLTSANKHVCLSYVITAPKVELYFMSLQFQHYNYLQWQFLLCVISQFLQSSFNICKQTSQLIVCYYY